MGTRDSMTMRQLLAVLAALFLPITPTHAQVWFAGEVGASLHGRGSFTPDIPDFHISCRTSIHLCFDVALGTSWSIDKVYDLFEVDLSYDALLHLDERTTLVPRVGLSSMTINDRTDQGGMNAGIALRRGGILGRDRSPDVFLRVDAVYRRLAGQNWVTLAVGAEARLGKHPARFPPVGGEARSPQPTGRHGFWAEFGVGGGSGSFSCDTCRSGPRLGGAELIVAVGGTPSPHVQLGAEWRFWMHGLASDSQPEIETGTALLTYYPRARGGPFVEGGVGLAYYLLRGGPDTTFHSGRGWGSTIGLGWELALGRHAALRPLVAYSLGAVGTLRSPDGAPVATGWKQNLLSLEIRVLGRP
jgi:hypothetical protein